MCIDVSHGGCCVCDGVPCAQYKRPQRVCEACYIERMIYTVKLMVNGCIQCAVSFPADTPLLDFMRYVEDTLRTPVAQQQLRLGASADHVFPVNMPPREAAMARAQLLHVPLHRLGFRSGVVVEVTDVTNRATQQWRVRLGGDVFGVSVTGSQSMEAVATGFAVAVSAVGRCRSVWGAVGVLTALSSRHLGADHDTDFNTAHRPRADRAVGESSRVTSSESVPLPFPFPALPPALSPSSSATSHVTRQSCGCR